MSSVCVSAARSLLAVCAALAAVSGPVGGQKSASVQQQVEREVAAFRGLMGVAARSLTSGAEIAVNADIRFPTASVIKTAVMAEVYHQIAEGRLAPDTVVPWTGADKVGGSGVVRHLHDGAALTVADLVRLMIVVSDNTATNLLVGQVGTANVDRRMAGYGLGQTKIFRPTFRDGRADVFPDEEKEFGLGMSTPSDMARLMALIAEGRIVSRAASDEMIDILNGQQDNGMIPRMLPGDAEVAHKTGTDAEKAPDAAGVHRHVRADAAIVTTKTTRYVIAIFARHVEDTSWGIDNAALVTGARVARLVHDAFTSGR